MKQCGIIQDLLPLYIDDAVSPESRALVEEHLATCADCERAYYALRKGAPKLGAHLPEGAAPSEDARFLTRLKHRVGSIIGMGLVLLVLTAFGANWFGRWRADREFGQSYEARTREEKAAVAAIKDASPDPLARLKAAGVELTYEARRENGGVRIDYRLTSSGPAEQAVSHSSPYEPSPRLYDPRTGQDLGSVREHGSGTSPGKPTEGYAYFAQVGQIPGPVEATLPSFQVYIKPDRELSWEVRRPGEEGDVLLGQRFTVAGVEFEVERVRFAKDRVQIDYRQLTAPAQVGVHLLSFRLSDRMGGAWGGDAPLDRLPDPLRPSQTFELVASFSKVWSIRVEHAVLAIPGPAIPVEVK